MSFITKVAVDCGKDFYEQHLREELIKMGYEENFLDWGFNSINNVARNWRNSYGFCATSGGDFNLPKNNNPSAAPSYYESNGFIRIHCDFPKKSELFLALAAMRDHADFGYGEMLVTTVSPPNFAGYFRGVSLSLSEVHVAIGGREQVCKNPFTIRKATAEEILNHFGYKESEWFQEATPEITTPKETEVNFNADLTLAEPGKQLIQIGDKVWAWNLGIKRTAAHFLCQLPGGRYATHEDWFIPDYIREGGFKIWDNVCPIDEPIQIKDTDIKEFFSDIYGVPPELIHLP